MPRNYQPVEFNTFVGGLVTEASPLNFPTNASLDEENFVLNKDGTRSRRLGMQFESGYQVIESSSALVNGEIVTSSFKWSNAGGLSTNTIICVQMGNTIDFFKGNAEIVSQNKLYTYTFAGLTPIEKFSYASVDGKLIVATGQKQICVFQYDTTNPNPATAFSVSFKSLLIRDFFGLDDGSWRVGTGISTRPSGDTGNHLYNLRNQGWAVPRPAWGGGDAPVDVIQAFVGAAGKYPSNADNITSYIYANTDSSAGSKTIDRFDAQNIASNPPSNTEGPVGYFIIDALDRGNSRKAVITDLASKYPANSPFYTSSIMSALKLDQTNGGPKCVCEYGGRIFYAGFPGEVVEGDIYSPKMNAYVLFSQLVTNEGEINLCYQAADPTDPHSSDLVDTDGGFIRIEGAYGIVGMAVLQSTLFVLAENGVWAVSGGSGGGFTATNYQTSKLTNSGCVSIGSVVVMQDSIFYWGMDGIYAITRNEFGDFKSNNITNKTIKKFYMAIPDASIRKAEGVYDSYDGYVKWLYNNYLGADDDPIELNLDVNSGAYFKLRIKPLVGNYPLVVKGIPTDPYRISVNTNQVIDSSGNRVVTSDGSLVTLDSSQQISGLKEIVYLTLTDDAHYTFSGYTEPFHFDWTDIDGIGLDAYAYLLTGVLSGGDYQRGKQIVYQTTHFGKTETGTSSLIYTSRPYPIFSEDSLLVGSSPTDGDMHKTYGIIFTNDGLGFSATPLSGSLRGTLRSYNGLSEQVVLSAVPLSGTLISKLRSTDTSDQMLLSASPMSGSLVRTLIQYVNWPAEGVAVAALPISGSLSSPSDPYFSSVRSLLHFDGTSGSTSIVDQISGRSWTAASGNQLSTAQAKFGSTSLLVANNGITCSAGLGGAIGTQDFTFEAFVYLTSVPNTYVIQKIGTTAPNLVGNTAGGLQFSDGSSWHTSSGTTIPLNQWVHVAASRNSGTIRLFINGTLCHTSAMAANFADGLTQFGSDTSGNYLHGYMDESRITIGVGRYTASFTPPSSPFPNN